uniref:Uncharacterized protein n=1 Tax=Arion vulgaris TaxID=1028688 RepID=A0A0B6ZR21_9EUPU
MVIAIDKVTETVAVVSRPSYQQQSVYSRFEFSDHRRHKEEINFRPVLHPIWYADTAYVYINNTRKRFVSKTFYEPRVRPQSFSDTTYNNPKSGELHYVTYLDYHVDENRKWFKTCVEIKAKKFTSAQILRSQNNNYINTSSIVSSSADMSPSHFSNGAFSNDDANFNRGPRSATAQDGSSFSERYDPGASQVFIPKRQDRSFGHQSLVNGQLILNFPNSKVDYNSNGFLDDYSDA